MRTTLTGTTRASTLTSTKWQAGLLNQTAEMLDLGEADDAPMYMKEINGALFAACGTKVIMITDWDTSARGRTRARSLTTPPA